MTKIAETERAWDLVDDIDVCMFVTKTGKGLRSRPMSSIGKREEGKIYFLTDARAAKDDEIAKDGTVLLGYADGKKYLSVGGNAQLSEDRTLVKRLWNPGAQAFWPKGPDDPAIIAIIVTPEAAEYWDGPNGFVAGVKFAWALATGTTPDFGDNAKVDLAAQPRARSSKSQQGLRR